METTFALTLCSAPGRCQLTVALVACGACVHGFRGMVANTEIVFSWLSLQGSLQSKQTEMPMPQGLSLKVAYMHTIKIAA